MGTYDEEQPHTSQSQRSYYEKDYSYQNPPEYVETQIPEDSNRPVDTYPIEIQMAFLRKVYAILTFQFLLTAGVASIFLFVDPVKDWVQENSWIIYVNIIPTIIFLVLAMIKRKTYPINFVFLSLFTICQAFTVGVIVSFVDLDIVLQALLITLGVFVALTIFTLQTKINFSGLGPFLFAGLIALLMLGLMQLFFRNDVLYIVYCAIGVFIFCGLIIYDTYLMKTTYSPEDYLIAAISLYQDVIQLFLFILNLLRICRD